MRELIRHILHEHTTPIIEYVKSNTQEFIKDAKKTHGDRYDYSNSNYVDSKTKVKIICPVHGEFLQNPRHHINGSGCPKCSYRPSSTETFIKKSKLKHGDFYDYSKVKYENGNSKVEIICPKHGSFIQRAAAHVFGSGCPKCWQDRNRNDISDFLKLAIEKHGKKFDYSKVNYTNNYTKVKITCPLHGEFEQTPSNHLSGLGCPKCSLDSMKKSLTLSTDAFIDRAKQVHGNKFDYNISNYKSATDKIQIICPTHGKFTTTPYSHLDSIHGGCQKCSKTYRLTNDEFIELSKEIHKNKYLYDKTKYVNMDTPVSITCKRHGVFVQRPAVHLRGSGCPVCNESSGELLIYEFLESNNIVFTREKKFDDCFNRSESGRCTKLEFDFYLPALNTIIEYDGKQHFVPIEFYGGVEGFEKSKKRDKIKDEYCKKKGIKLIRIPYKMSPEEIETYLLMELEIAE